MLLNAQYGLCLYIQCLFGQLQYVLSLNLGCVFHGSLIMRVEYKSFANTKTAEYFSQQVFVTELTRDVR